MIETAYDRRMRLAYEREVAKVSDAATGERALLQATIDEQAATITALQADVAKNKQDIATLDAKVDDAIEVKP